jgi:hypothetical protein
MNAKVGDRIVVESERVGQAQREGVILEIFESSTATNYRVRWDDGRETEIRPSAGSARIVAAPARQKKVSSAR